MRRLNMRLLKRHVPYRLEHDQWGVLDRATGELLHHDNGDKVRVPWSWANHEANQLNGVKQR